MKNSLLLLAGATALSLSSCSQTSTTDTATTTGTPADTTAMATTTTTKHVMTDTDYHMRGDRMAMKFASANKISDQAMMNKLKMAYYERAKRYDMMMDKYQADTAGMGAARRQYMMDTNKDFQTILVVPAQYQSYQSSMSTPDYDESSNMDVTEQGASSDATMPASSGSSMSNGSTSDMSTTPTDGSAMGSGAGVEASKTKMSDGSKVKVKEDGTVKMKDADGNKTKM